MNNKTNKWIDINLPFYSSDDDNSFCESELIKPGTLIKVNGKIYLIGHINTAGGTCDCCEMFDNNSIVESYKIIWRE